VPTNTDQPEIDDDIFAPEVIADPYSYYNHLREVDPVHRNEQYKLWIVTRYDDCSWLTLHPELFSSAIDAKDPLPPYPPIEPGEEEDAAHVKKSLQGRIIQTDPPAHTDRRGVFKKYFSAAHMKDWRPMITRAVNRLLDDVQSKGNGRMDVMRDFAVPLPLMVICELMEIPEEQRYEIRAIADQMDASPLKRAQRMHILANALRAMDAYIEPLVEERIDQPGNDLISLAAGAERDGILTRDLVLQNLSFFVMAGHETTINLICNGILSFIRNPDQWDLMRSDPDKYAGTATEECLRYDPPAIGLERIAAQEINLRGKTIQPLDRVRWSACGANRDPERFTNPESFDITRSPNTHLTFGHGIHLCLGAYLARTEGQVIFPALAARFGRFKLETDQLEYLPAINVRSLRALEVSW
jgi:cytochrome P450